MTSIVTDDKKNLYATIMETSGEECESWYYFIKWDGNEEKTSDISKSKSIRSKCILWKI